MNTRLSWGTPITETEVNAFEAAARARAGAGAAFAAADAAQASLERIARLSTGLIQIQALFLIVVLMLAGRTGAAPMPFAQWSVLMMLVSCLLLLPNLLPTSNRRSPTDPREQFDALMRLHKVRAPRYVIGLVLAFAAVLLVFVSLARVV